MSAIAHNADTAFSLICILSRVCVTLDGVLDWRLNLLTTYRLQLQITNTITNVHTLQMTIAQGKSFQSAVSSSVVPW
jgi:hypothetical protein